MSCMNRAATTEVVDTAFAPVFSWVGSSMLHLVRIAVSGPARIRLAWTSNERLSESIEFDVASAEAFVIDANTVTVTAKGHVAGTTEVAVSLTPTSSYTASEVQLHVTVPVGASTVTAPRGATRAQLGRRALADTFVATLFDANGSQIAEYDESTLPVDGVSLRRVATVNLNTTSQSRFTWLIRV